MNKSIGYLYINGLGYGSTTLKDRVVKWWWSRAGLTIEHAHVNWYDDVDLANKLAVVEQKINQMLLSFKGLAVIGSSAGGSLAINAFYRLRQKNVCAINAHGRLKKGAYLPNNRMSLNHRAHLDTSRPAQAFYDSVIMFENNVMPNLSNDEKQRLLLLTQLTDMVVPLDTMIIDGVRQHRSFTLGHSGGFLAHMLADRDLIRHFAEEQLFDR